jgi:hypothetical protein
MKSIGLVVLLIVVCINMQAQLFNIEIQDNQGQMQGMVIYTITNDSLLIKSKSDYGRSNVDYLSRTLTAKEKKAFTKFIKSFPVDSLLPEYFNEYNNFDYIDAEHYPRVIALNINYAEKFYGSKLTNAYVRFYAHLFDHVNPMLPNEVKINFDKNKFNAFY